MLFSTFAGKLALVYTQTLSQAQCCGLLGIELLTEIKHMTHLGKMPHMEQLGVGTWYERLLLLKLNLQPYKDTKC